jgi:hypothetical protein
MSAAKIFGSIYKTNPDKPTIPSKDTNSFRQDPQKLYQGSSSFSIPNC